MATRFSRYSSAMAFCIIAAAAATSANADRLPGLLEDTPYRPISVRFPMPDWLSFASARFGETEQSLLTLHPRVDAAATNVRGVIAPGGFAVQPSLVELCEKGVAAEHAFVAPCPVSSALRADDRDRQPQPARIVPSNGPGSAATTLADLPVMFDLSLR